MNKVCLCGGNLHQLAKKEKKILLLYLSCGYQTVFIYELFKVNRRHVVWESIGKVEGFRWSSLCGIKLPSHLSAAFIWKQTMASPAIRAVIMTAKVKRWGAPLRCVCSVLIGCRGEMTAVLSLMWSSDGPQKPVLSHMYVPWRQRYFGAKVLIEQHEALLWIPYI